jgi:hypothetical protein
MTATSIRKMLLIIILATLGFTGIAGAQQDQKKSKGNWKIGEEFKYEIVLWNQNVGYSTGMFVGPVKHSAIGNALLFRINSVITRPTTQTKIVISSEMFTDGSGHPGFYTAEYIEINQTSSIQGYLEGATFKLKKKIDTTETEFDINISPSTILCDKQSIPQWNIAFNSQPDLDQDTLHFSVLIPYLEKRARMRMIRQPDEKMKVLGQEMTCRVYFSPRTEEYYYITPDKKVARVYLPKQKLNYNLISIEKKPLEYKQDK